MNNTPLEICIHHIYTITCTYCKKAAAPIRTYTSSYNRTTASQIVAISKLAHIKQRSLPSNISSWSASFASKYIKFLYSLPFPQEVLPRLEQFEKEHITATDIYKSSHYAKQTEFFWADGMTKPITLAIEQGDSADLADGAVKEVSNV